MVCLKSKKYVLGVSPRPPGVHWTLREAPGGQPKSSWNQKILLIKVYRYDSLMKKSSHRWIDRVVSEGLQIEEGKAKHICVPNHS